MIVFFPESEQIFVFNGFASSTCTTRLTAFLLNTLIVPGLFSSFILTPGKAKVTSISAVGFNAAVYYLNLLIIVCRPAL